MKRLVAALLMAVCIVALSGCTLFYKKSKVTENTRETSFGLLGGLVPIYRSSEEIYPPPPHHSGIVIEKNSNGDWDDDDDDEDDDD